MPVLTLHYDSSLEARVAKRQDALACGIASILRERLFAEPEKCQIVMLRALRAEPFPVFIRLDFRARETRTVEAVGAALRALADLIERELSTAVRLRAFAIETAVLHALDQGDPHGA